MTSHPRRITRALLSVSDKTGLVDFANALADLPRKGGGEGSHSGNSGSSARSGRVPGGAGGVWRKLQRTLACSRAWP